MIWVSCNEHIFQKRLGSKRTMRQHYKSMWWWRRHSKEHSNMLDRTWKQRRTTGRGFGKPLHFTKLSLFNDYTNSNFFEQLGYNTASKTWQFKSSFQEDFHHFWNFGREFFRKLINFRWKSWSSLNFSFTLNSWRSTTYEYQPMIVGMFELLFVFHCNDSQNIQTSKVGYSSTIDNTDNLFNFGIIYNSNGEDYLSLSVHGLGYFSLGDFSCCPSGSVQVKVDKRQEGASCVITVRSSLSGGNASPHDWTSSPRDCGSYSHATTQVWMKGSHSYSVSGQIENFYFTWL